MSDERITTYETPEAGHTTTVIHEGSSSGSSAGTWLLGIVVLIAVLAAVYFLAIRSDSDVVKNNAIAGAAEQVGDAAQQVGNAAETAADKITPE